MSNESQRSDSSSFPDGVPAFSEDPIGVLSRLDDCVPPFDEDKLRVLRSSLASPDYLDREGVRFHLENLLLKDPDRMSYLPKLLGDPDGLVRQTTAMALVKIASASKEGLAVFCDALKIEDALVRHTLLFSLVDLSAENKKYGLVPEKAMNHPDRSVRAAATSIHRNVVRYSLRREHYRRITKRDLGRHHFAVYHHPEVFDKLLALLRGGKTLKRQTIWRLDVFMVFVSEGSLLKASKELQLEGVKAVSYHIHKLEDQLGTVLVHAPKSGGRKRVEPTEVGTMLAEWLEVFLPDFREEDER